MKHFLAMLVAVVLWAGVLTGCSAKTEASSAAPSSAPSSSSPESAQTSSAASPQAAAVPTNDFAAGTQAYENFSISYEAPTAWERKTKEDGQEFFYPPVDSGVAFLMINPAESGSAIRTEEYLEIYAEGMEKSLGDDVKRIKCGFEENAAGSRYAALNLEGEMQGRPVRLYNAIFNVSGGSILVGFLEEFECGKDFSQDFQRVVDTVRIIEKSASEKEADSASQAPQAASETMGQRNALSTAKNYLRVMPFSHSGLVQQLEFEGFTTEEATYGADNCGADWSVQASKKAQDYLDTMSFSRKSLIQQLEFEGFTNEEATGAVDGCGADWNEQAAKKAQDYIDTMSMSRSGLLSQLQFEGFTPEQAEYGVSAVGY